MEGSNKGQKVSVEATPLSPDIIPTQRAPSFTTWLKQRKPELYAEMVERATEDGVDVEALEKGIDDDVERWVREK